MGELVNLLIGRTDLSWVGNGIGVLNLIIAGESVLCSAKPVPIRSCLSSHDGWLIDSHVPGLAEHGCSSWITVYFPTSFTL